MKFLILSLITSLFLLGNINTQSSTNKLIIDYPEEFNQAVKGDTMCYHIQNDTIFIEFYKNYPNQRDKLKYVL